MLYKKKMVQMSNTEYPPTLSGICDFVDMFALFLNYISSAMGWTEPNQMLNECYLIII